MGKRNALADFSSLSPPFQTRPKTKIPLESQFPNLNGNKQSNFNSFLFQEIRYIKCIKRPEPSLTCSLMAFNVNVSSRFGFGFFLFSPFFFLPFPVVDEKHAHVDTV